MKLVASLEQYDGEYLSFCDSIKNNVVNEGTYLRLIYSTPTFTMHGVHLHFTVTPISFENHHNKCKIKFDKHIHKELINKLKRIEEEVIAKSDIRGKIPHYKIFEQIGYGYVKIHMDGELSAPVAHVVHAPMKMLLKISGVWETDFNYGVTYKFTGLNS